jgi:phage tail protein X
VTVPPTIKDAKPKRPAWVDSAPVLAPEGVNICLYGPAGTGKSSAAATIAPEGGRIVWVNMDGPNSLFFARKLAAERNVEILEARIGHDEDPRPRLREALDFCLVGNVDALVIDGVGKLRESLATAIGGPNPQVADWGQVARYLKDLFREGRDLRCSTVWVCHEQITEDDGKLVVRPEIDAKGKAAELLLGEVDVCAYTAVHDDDGNQRFVGQIVPDKGRRAKDRSGALGAWRDLVPMAEWVQVFRSALAPDLSDVPFINQESEGDNED